MTRLGAWCASTFVRTPSLPACGVSRDNYCHPPKADQDTLDLHEKIVEIAHMRRHFDYRRIHDLLRPQFPGVNHKRVRCLYPQANLAVRWRKKRKRPINERLPLQLAQTVNDVWSMDFVSDSLSGGWHLKYLMADDFSHERVDIAVNFGICHPGPGPRCGVSRVSEGGAHRQRPGVHQPGIHRQGAGARHPPHPKEYVNTGRQYSGQFRRNARLETAFTLASQRARTHLRVSIFPDI